MELVWQAKLDYNGRKYMKEQHIHALANIKDKHIYTFEQHGGKLKILEYQPGWGAQRQVVKAEAVRALSGPAPPVCIHRAPDHFSAVVPVPAKGGGPIRCVRRIKEFGNNANSPIVTE